MRRWLERSVFVAAALACVATSPRRWSLPVDKLPSVPDPTRATRLFVESSERPEVGISSLGVSFKTLEPVAVSNTLSIYTIPAGSSLASVEIRHTCSIGCGYSDDPCEQPRDAFVRVTKITSVAMWHVEASSKPITTAMDPSRPPPKFEVRIDANHDAVVTVTSDVEVSSEVHPSGARQEIVLFPKPKERPHDVTWTAHATIEGPCLSDKPCEAPAGEHVTIVSVEPKAADAP